MSRIAIVNFNSGEISPELDARPDIEKYVGGCRSLKNMIPDVFGNATRRPGTELIQIGNGYACYYEAIVPDETKIGITTMEELALIGNDEAYPLSGDYELLNNLDGTGFDFTPIGTPALPFEGTFDGNNFSISNITYTTTDKEFGGLFVKLVGSTIENLNISNMTITGPAVNTINFSAGLLCASSLGTASITNVHVSGSITAHRLVNVGGLGGQINHHISMCSADVAITANGNYIFDVGGLVGICGSETIDNTYAQGSITSVPELVNVGGLIGQGTPVVQAMTNSYSAVIITGTVSANVGGLVGLTADTSPDYTSCFWDDTIIPVLDLDDIGDEGDDDGITKSTTGAMQAQSTFTGWDFTDIWYVPTNDYPRFLWQKEADKKLICYPL